MSTALEDSTPGEVVGEVASSDAMKSSHPFLESVVIGIDVLDVESHNHDLYPCAQPG